MITWTETKLGIHYVEIEGGLTLFIEPIGEVGYSAHVHRPGSFEKHNERDFFGPDAFARAKKYMTRIGNLFTGQRQ